MAPTLESKGSKLMNGTEQELFPAQVGLEHYSLKAFFDKLVAGDEIILRVYDFDDEELVEKRYITDLIQGLQQNPIRLVNWIPSSSFRVTCQQVHGVNKTITWALYTPS